MTADDWLRHPIWPEYNNPDDDTATIVRTEWGIGIGQGAQHVALFAETPRVLTQGGQTFAYSRPR